jgi:hypothetical protein
MGLIPWRVDRSASPGSMTVVEHGKVWAVSPSHDGGRTSLKGRAGPCDDKACGGWLCVCVYVCTHQPLEL